MSFIALSRVIIESPYSGNVEANIAYAKRAVADSLSRGEAPIASHLLIAAHGILDDNLDLERMVGMEAGWSWIPVADFVAVYHDRGISSGMLMGIDLARQAGKRIEYRLLGCDVKEASA